MFSNQPCYMTNSAKIHKFYKKGKGMKFLTFKPKALIKIRLLATNGLL